MANKPGNKMPIEERAKQFMPFAALKGLPEALAAKEEQIMAAQQGFPLSPTREDTSLPRSRRQSR